jgi:nitrite reductase/ring-hydroxylating ferredoxin subunit
MRERRLMLVLVASVLALVLPACASDAEPGSPQRNEPISGTWVDVETNGDSTVLPVAEVTGNGNVHFSVVVNERKMDFMAYALGDVLNVRANACPPCRSIGFALDGSVLVCDTCQTTFDATDGSGIEGACVDYPKAAVDYRVDGDLIVMSADALVQAYDDTLAIG